MFSFSDLRARGALPDTPMGDSTAHRAHEHDEAHSSDQILAHDRAEHRSGPISPLSERDDGCACCDERPRSRGSRMHVEGEGAEHFLHAVEVRDAWLATAMREAESMDRSSGVWSMASDVWEPSDIVIIEGLCRRPDLNGVKAILLRWLPAPQRWAVSVITTDERVKVKPANLRRIARHSVESLEPIEGTSAGASAGSVPTVLCRHLPVGVESSSARPAKGASFAAELVADAAAALRARGHIAVDGFLGAGSSAPIRAHLCGLEESGALIGGDIAGGRAAAAYARITGQSLPRGDLMVLLDRAEADAHEPLAELFAETDSLLLALEAQPALADGLGGDGDKAAIAALASSHRLQREEVQLTCYPGGGARYVRHVDNNSISEGRARGPGRCITCIYYANNEWKAADGGELRLHLESQTVDIAPLGDRLVLFWSDERVPHEVLPSYAARYAVSMWYHSE